MAEDREVISRCVDRQRIRYLTRIESLSVIPDDDGHSVVIFAAAADVDQLACIQTIAVKQRVAQGLPKREFDVFFLATDTTGRSNQAHKTVHQRRDLADLARHAGVYFQRRVSETKSLEHRLQ